MRQLLLGFMIAGFCSAQEQELLSVRRVFIEQLNGGDSAYQIRDLIMTAIQNSKLFVLTENKNRADAIMRGSADDTVFDDTFSSSEGLTARASGGSISASTAKSNTGSKSDTALRNNSARGPDVSFGQNESTHIKERKHEAIATVRLVNKDGDVIWSTTQESLGAKFRGASADVAEKITRQLTADIEKARKSAALK